MIVEAALDGRVGAASLILFLLVFLWTPPHFWAIAIFRKDEYAAAGFPMMPNVVGDAATRRQSLLYAVGTALVSLAPVPLGLASPVYGIVALCAGIWFGAAVWRSMVADDPRVDWRVFKVSIAYLFLVFGALLVDCALRSWLGAGVDLFGLFPSRLVIIPVI
jgi:protoheme IX farnesyltransferase